MLDTLVEILLEIIVNGALDASDSKKVAMPVRITAGSWGGTVFGSCGGHPDLEWNCTGKPAADHLRRSLFGTGHPAGREQNHPFSKGPQAVTFQPAQTWKIHEDILKQSGEKYGKYKKHRLF